MQCIVVSIAAAVHLSPTPNGTSEIQHFERSDALKICDGIISTRDCYNSAITASDNELTMLVDSQCSSQSIRDASSSCRQWRPAQQRQLQEQRRGCSTQWTTRSHSDGMIIFSLSQYISYLHT